MDNNNINYLKIQSVNCQGLGDKSKRKDVFNYLHNKKYNIFFLQDTHFVQEDEKMIQTQWGFEAYFSSYRSNARGVAILFKNNFEFKVNDAFSDIYGNSLMLDVNIENKQYLLVNIYGPNEDDPQIYKDIGKKLKQYQIIITLLWVVTSIWLWLKTLYYEFIEGFPTFK